MTAKSSALPVIKSCWSEIGVGGDRSCPELRTHIHCRNCPVFAASGQHLYDRPPPTGYLEEWTERIAAPENPPAGKTIPVLIFRVQEEWLAIDVVHAVEVAPARKIRRIPHQTDNVLSGLVNIRGELHLAVSLRSLLGITDQPTNALSTAPDLSRLLVVERGSARWVFEIDEVSDIEHLEESSLGSLPSTVAAGTAVFTRGVFRWNGRAVGYLDPERVFAALRRNFR